MTDPQSPFRTTVDDVPLEQGLREEEGWIDMQVQYLINSERGGSDGLTVDGRCCRRAPATSATSTPVPTSSSW